MKLIEKTNLNKTETFYWSNITNNLLDKLFTAFKLKRSEFLGNFN